jgi:hypothetical protein
MYVGNSRDKVDSQMGVEAVPILVVGGSCKLDTTSTAESLRLSRNWFRAKLNTVATACVEHGDTLNYCARPWTSRAKIQQTIRLLGALVFRNIRRVIQSKLFYNRSVAAEQEAGWVDADAVAYPTNSTSSLFMA